MFLGDSVTAAERDRSDPRAMGRACCLHARQVMGPAPAGPRRRVILTPTPDRSGRDLLEA